MAVDKKISQLASGAPAQAGDEYVVARSGANYKLTLTNIAASMPPIGATTPNTGSFTSLTNSGNLTFSSTAQRITGDMSNATLSNRLFFQNSVTNANTDVAAIPNGTGTAANFTAFGSSSDQANTTLMRMGVDATTTFLNSFRTGTGSYFPLTFSTGGSERMRIDSSGNVGIGTTNTGTAGLSLSQTVNLSWEQSSTESLPNIFRQASSAATVITNGYKRSATANGFASSYGSSWAKSAISLGTASGSITFYTDTAATTAVGTDVTPTERMRITSGGNVNIGTTTDVARLHVSRSDNDVSARVANSLSTGLTSDMFQVIALNHAAGTGFYFHRCYSSSATVQFAVRGDGTIYAQNTTVQSLSDARVKENVRTATEGLAVIDALRPVRFDFKEGFGNNRKNQLGFVAQEVEAVFPDAVDVMGDKDENGNPYKSVGPAALIPVLVKAIQELSAKVAALEAK